MTLAEALRANFGQPRVPAPQSDVATGGMGNATPPPVSLPQQPAVDPYQQAGEALAVDPSKARALSRAIKGQ